MDEILTPAHKPFSLLDWLTARWFTLFAVNFGLWAWAPFLAPVFMRLGWESPANAIYFIYSFFCHQLPQRSYFLFGPKVSYSLVEIQAVWMDTINPLLLRKFVGAPEMGWKLAWTDRMIWLYSGIWLFGLLWRPLRCWIKSLSWRGLALFLLPLAIDGGTHLISDLAGIGQGFRDSNAWLAAMTGQIFPAWFYAGDALGSFNSWMRMLTGLLAAWGLVWFAFPHAAKTFTAE